MKAGEERAPPKISKAASTAPEAAAMPSYPEWPNSMQAYYGAAPTASPFFASAVTSPASHPYIWGGQHALIPPYGTPVPYPVYPPSGVYAHPSMTPINLEMESKESEGKDKNSNKKHLANKLTDNGKVTSGSGNDAASHSADAGSEGSSNASDDNSKQESTTAKNGKFDQIITDGSAQTMAGKSSLQAWKASGSMPATNLNIGMDLWSSPPAGTAVGPSKARGNPSPVAAAIAPSGMQDQWIQDERELKRQKRKQSNRESARRSRLRKQAECEELQARVQNLTNDNRELRDELKRLSQQCDKFKMENHSMKEELTRLHGADALANLELGNSSSLIQAASSEGRN